MPIAFAMMNSSRARPTPSTGRKECPKACSGLPDVHEDLGARRRQLARVGLALLEAQQALHHEARLSLGAGDGDGLSVREQRGGVARADDAGDAELARDDGRVAGAPAAIGHDGRGAFQDRLPVGIGHAGHEHAAGREVAGLRRALEAGDRPGADLGADGAAARAHRARARADASVTSFAGSRRACAVSGRAWRMKSSPLLPSLAHSMSIGRGSPARAL